MDRRDFMAAGAAALAALRLPQDDDGLVVHEWGVVTIPYGVDRVSLRTAGGKRGDGGVEVPAGLPEFVSTWKGALDQFAEEWSRREIDKPIVYFYSESKSTVSLKVSVPTGLPRAWWPPADEIAPRPDLPWRGGLVPDEGPLVEQRIKDIKPVNGRLLWKKLDVVPDGKPSRAADGWWETARKTDAAAVRSGNETEKFLFYDAFATYDPPLTIDWKKDGTVDLANKGDGPFPHLFAIRVKDGKCASAHHKALGKGDKASLTLVDGAPKAVADALVESGLYAKEAEGLVEIWKNEFFTLDGIRVLTVVPRETYDRLLPVEITPKPRDFVRVLVAHIECLDPARRDEIAALIAELGSDEVERRESANAKLRARLPLAEPLIRAAVKTADDPEVRVRLEGLLNPDSKP